MSNLQRIIYLNEAQKTTLFTNNTITVNGRIINYSPNDIYITPDESIQVGTTAEWQANLTYIPSAGTILIYTDKDTINNVDIPGIKIGDGLAYGIDLPFVGDDIAADLLAHINDTTKHITAAERTTWNNKINCNDTVTGETLVLNRN